MWIRLYLSCSRLWWGDWPSNAAWWRVIEEWAEEMKSLRSTNSKNIYGDRSIWKHTLQNCERENFKNIVWLETIRILENLLESCWISIHSFKTTQWQMFVLSYALFLNIFFSRCTYVMYTLQVAYPDYFSLQVKHSASLVRRSAAGRYYECRTSIST